MRNSKLNRKHYFAGCLYPCHYMTAAINATQENAPCANGYSDSSTLRDNACSRRIIKILYVITEDSTTALPTSV